MAYGNYYPGMYQPAPVQQQNANGGIIWVSGEAGAKAFLVAPNTTVQLWDSESQTIYLKSADASGMPSIKILDYVAREATNTPKVAETINLDDYVTRKDFDAFEEKIKKQLKKLAARGDDDE